MDGAQPRRTIHHFAHMSNGVTIDSRRVLLDAPITRSWAIGGADGSGVRICLVDSGVEERHPDVGRLPGGCWTVEPDARAADGYRMVSDDAGDLAGHGTACASIIRRVAAGAELASVRILGPKLGGDGGALITALRWAIDQRFDLINLSLSTRKQAYKEELHDQVDRAFFAGSLVVAAAHNSAVVSYPWQFASVVSVGSHAESDPFHLEVNGVRIWIVVAASCRPTNALQVTSSPWPARSWRLSSAVARDSGGGWGRS